MKWEGRGGEGRERGGGGEGHLLKEGGGGRAAEGGRKRPFAKEKANEAANGATKLQRLGRGRALGHWGTGAGRGEGREAGKVAGQRATGRARGRAATYVQGLHHALRSAARLWRDRTAERHAPSQAGERMTATAWA